MEGRQRIRAVFMGPPGAGKGTQAYSFATTHQVGHLSTGDMLRDLAKTNPEVYKKMKSTERVNLDDVVIELVKNSLQTDVCKYGFILDGFPRNLVQAEKLEKFLDSIGEPLNKVIQFKLEDNILYDRIDGRLVHSPSGRTYHKAFIPPEVPGIDNVTGESLTHRETDTHEILQRRIQFYHDTTECLSEFYAERGILATIDAAQTPNEVFQRISHEFGKCIITTGF